MLIQFAKSLELQTLENKFQPELHAMVYLSYFEVFGQLGEEVLFALVGLLLGIGGEHRINKWEFLQDGLRVLNRLKVVLKAGTFSHYKIIN